MRKSRRKTGPIRHYCLIFSIFAAASAPGQEPDDLASAFDRSTIIIEAEKHACYRFEVYLAASRAQQVRGLMYVRHLPEFSGMLFIHEEAAMHSMWMKNTYIPLDILFIREDGTISNIVESTEPLSLASIRSTEPVFYVLELNAGVTARLDIGTGSRVYLHGTGN